MMPGKSEPAANVPITDLVRAVCECFPDIVVHSYGAIGEGWDSIAVEINHQLIARFPKRRATFEAVAREIKLLDKLRDYLAVPIPCVLYDSTTCPEARHRFVGYRKLPGIPLKTAWYGAADKGRVMQSIGLFLRELHKFPIDICRDVGVPVYTPSAWRERYLELFREVQTSVLPIVTSEVRSKAEELFSTFLETRDNFRFDPVLSHGDFNWEHILVDEKHSTVSGVIDFGDVLVGDPAVDFGGLIYDFGVSFGQGVLTTYMDGVDSSFASRMKFYSHTGDFLEIIFGLETDDRSIVDDGIERLERHSRVNDVPCLMERKGVSGPR